MAVLLRTLRWDRLAPTPLPAPDPQAHSTAEALRGSPQLHRSAPLPPSFPRNSAAARQLRAPLRARGHRTPTAAAPLPTGSPSCRSFRTRLGKRSPTRTPPRALLTTSARPHGSCATSSHRQRRFGIPALSAAPPSASTRRPEQELVVQNGARPFSSRTTPAARSSSAPRRLQSWRAERCAFQRPNAAMGWRPTPRLRRPRRRSDGRPRGTNLCAREGLVVPPNSAPR